MFIVMTAAARMPGGVRAPYRRVAVVETDGTMPKMISDRAKGVIRIVETWERLNVGRGVRSAYVQALTEAEALCKRLNASERRKARRAARRAAKDAWQEAA